MSKPRKLVAVGMACWMAALPALADIIPNEPKGSSKDATTVAVVKERLESLGVAADDAERILAGLKPEEVEFFRAHPNTNAVVGQQEIVVLFWYEWIVGIAYAYAAWRLYDSWGRGFFLPGD